MTLTRILMVATACSLFFAGCAKNIAEVDSGTYEGVITEVNPEKNKIHVDIGDNHILEIFFTDVTTVTEDGQVVLFSALQTGQRVSVTVLRAGYRLDAVEVDILK